MTEREKKRQVLTFRLMRLRAEMHTTYGARESLGEFAERQKALMWKASRVQTELAVLLNGMSEPVCKKHVVQFSGGISSWFAAKRVIEKFGKDTVTLLFADTRMEDEDLYRFMDDASAKFDVPITVLADGRTPWDVFKDKQYLGNTRVDPCSLVLKRELLWAWIERNAPSDAIVFVGIDWSEEHRLVRLKEYRPGFNIDSPLLWPPMPDKVKMLKALEAEGIRIPKLYLLNFSHNNCGGFCIKSGQAQFRLLLETMPERYAFHEQKEQELREYLGKDVAVLRDRRGGKTRPLTLKEFRERIEAGGEHSRHDWGGCGCAIE